MGRLVLLGHANFVDRPVNGHDELPVIRAKVKPESQQKIDEVLHDYPGISRVFYYNETEAHHATARLMADKPVSLQLVTHPSSMQSLDPMGNPFNLIYNLTTVPFPKGNGTHVLVVWGRFFGSVSQLFGYPATKDRRINRENVIEVSEEQMGFLKTLGNDRFFRGLCEIMDELTEKKPLFKKINFTMKDASIVAQQLREVFGSTETSKNEYEKMLRYFSIMGFVKK